MIWSKILQVLLNIWFAGFAVQVILWVCSMFRNPEHEKNKVFLFVGNAGDGFLALWGFIYFILVFACMVNDVSPAPSFSTFKKAAAKFEEIDFKRSVTSGENKTVAENNAKRDYGNISSNLSDIEPETGNTIESNKPENVVENNETENTIENNKSENVVENNETENSSNKVLADKIKFAKKHKFTFLYDNKKVDAEDFDYKNSDVVVLNDLKLVIGMPK